MKRGNVAMATPIQIEVLMEKKHLYSWETGWIAIICLGKPWLPIVETKYGYPLIGSF